MFHAIKLTYGIVDPVEFNIFIRDSSRKFHHYASLPIPAISDTAFKPSFILKDQEGSEYNSRNQLRYEHAFSPFFQF